MYIVAFFIGFLFWKSCKFWRRLRALDYIWKSGVGFTLFYFTNLFVEILGRKGSGTMIFIVSWCYRGLAMVIFILFWQGSYPPGGTTRGLLLLLPVFLPLLVLLVLAKSSALISCQYRKSILANYCFDDDPFGKLVGCSKTPSRCWNAWWFAAIGCGFLWLALRLTFSGTASLCSFGC